MKNFVTYIVLLLLLVSCRSSREASSSTTTERHSDSVAALRSIGLKELQTETETTVIVMRPDTSGRLSVVSKDVTRTVTRSTETAVSGDTARFFVEDRHTTQSREETQDRPSTAATAANVWGIALVWACFAFVGLVGALIIWKLWKSRI